MTDTATATPIERLAAYRSSHRIFLVEERHPDFGLVHRCETDMIRVHATRNGRWFHDPSELKTLLDQNYGGPWGTPKVEPTCICFIPGGAGYCPVHRKDIAIERISSLFDPAEDDESEFVDDDREGQPEFNGSFR